MPQRSRSSDFVESIPEVEGVGLATTPEASPFWPLLAALAQIAERTERRQAKEQCAGIA